MRKLNDIEKDGQAGRENTKGNFSNNVTFYYQILSTEK